MFRRSELIRFNSSFISRMQIGTVDNPEGERRIIDDVTVHNAINGASPIAVTRELMFKRGSDAYGGDSGGTVFRSLIIPRATCSVVLGCKMVKVTLRNKQFFVNKMYNGFNFLIKINWKPLQKIVDFTIVATSSTPFSRMVPLVTCRFPPYRQSGLLAFQALPEGFLRDVLHCGDVYDLPLGAGHADQPHCLQAVSPCIPAVRGEPYKLDVSFPVSSGHLLHGRFLVYGLLAGRSRKSSRILKPPPGQAPAQHGTSDPRRGGP